MALLDKFAPKMTGMRDPRDANKRNGMFWNWPRFLFLGGAQQGFSQAGSKSPKIGKGEQPAVGPITDRGKGR